MVAIVPGQQRSLVAVALAMLLLPTTAFGQSSSPVPSLASPDAVASNPESTLDWPPLADLGRVLDPAEICDRAGGTFGDLGGPSCSLPTEMLAGDWIVGTWGEDQEAFSVAATDGPVVLSDLPPNVVPVLEGLTFAPSLPLPAKGVKRLERREKDKKAGVVAGKKTKWAEADGIGVATLHLSEPINARGLSRGGVLAVRLQNGDRSIDAIWADREPSLTRANGNKSDGFVAFDGDRIDFVVPGGLDQGMIASLIYIDADGLATGQQIAGPGGSDALIPPGSFAPVLACVHTSVGADPDSSTDTFTYDLADVGFTMATPLLPDEFGDAVPDISMSLSPSGSRAELGLEDLEQDLLPIADQRVRGAIAGVIDLAALGLVAETGFHYGEQPYVVTDITAAIDAGALDYDPELARSLLHEAGWTDADGDDVYEADWSSIADEMDRLTGAGFTESPAEFGWPGCGRNAHWQSVQDSCRFTHAEDLTATFGALLGEDPAELALQPGTFAAEHVGCTVQGLGETFLATYLLGTGFSEELVAYDPEVLLPFADIGCEVSNDPVVGAGLQLVGSCPDLPMQLYFDGSVGSSFYLGMGGSEHDLDVLSGTLLPLLVDPDLDGDGIADRFDDDLDGDGLSNASDPDDDGDLVADELDYAIFDPNISLSPSTFGDLLVKLEGGAN